LSIGLRSIGFRTSVLLVIMQMALLHVKISPFNELVARWGIFQSIETHSERTYGDTENKTCELVDLGKVHCALTRI